MMPFGYHPTPYIKLDVGKFLAFTNHLTREEIGTYILLISNYAMSGKSAYEVPEILEEFFTRQDGGWIPIADHILKIKFHKPKKDNRLPALEWEVIRNRVFKRDNYTCVYCGSHGGRLECDHIHPHSRGGSDEDSNLATACFRCNRSKRAKTVEEWRASA